MDMDRARHRVANMMEEEMRGEMVEDQVEDERSRIADLLVRRWRAVRMRACCHCSELLIKMVCAILPSSSKKLRLHLTNTPSNNEMGLSLTTTTGSGHLSENELSAALVNGDWTAFDPHTVTLMIRMFDTSRSGTISFQEFCGLWSFLASWRTLFDRFDADRSGNISIDEFSAALVAFGYRLSESFVGFLFRAFDKGKKGSLSFDLFVQACISLKRMTDAFKRYDDDRDGFVTLSFEQFLEEVLRQR